MSSTAIKERPILFRGELVRAILAGTKTVTRRPVKLNAKTILSPGQRTVGFHFNLDFVRVGDLTRMISSLAGHRVDADDQQISVAVRHPEDTNIPWEDCGYERVYCSYGSIGDRLWVRETWAPYDGYWIAYKAGHDICKIQENCVVDSGPLPTIIEKWHPSIHMPRCACRLLLEITAVRVERLHSITEADVLAEGTDPIHIEKNRKFFHTNDCHGLAFAELWNHIYGKGEFAWDRNPWVWRLAFKRAEASQ